MAKAQDWLKATPGGLVCEPGGFTIDPTAPVERAVITHGHGDHARPGSTHVLATSDTLEIMRTRFGPEAGASLQPLDYGDWLELGGVKLAFAPAGHVLGSAQVVMEYAGQRVVVSGDYKRRPDPTCVAVRAGGLRSSSSPRRPSACRSSAIPTMRARSPSCSTRSRLFPERTHLVGAYTLGKAQRVMALLRRAGWQRPIWLHGALFPLTDLYRAPGRGFRRAQARDGRRQGRAQGPDRAGATGCAARALVAADGRAAARHRVGLDAACAPGPARPGSSCRWSSPTMPIGTSSRRRSDEVGASEIWVTHGREEALVHYAQGLGIKARALAMVG